jgi:exodeoxyribonuclease III
LELHHPAQTTSGNYLILNPYFRNAFARNAGIRIDHLLLSPDLAPTLSAAGVDRDIRALEKTSDHAPAWIDLG